MADAMRDKTEPINVSGLFPPTDRLPYLYEDPGYWRSPNLMVYADFVKTDAPLRVPTIGDYMSEQELIDLCRSYIESRVSQNDPPHYSVTFDFQVRTVKIELPYVIQFHFNTGSIQCKYSNTYSMIEFYYGDFVGKNASELENYLDRIFMWFKPQA